MKTGDVVYLCENEFSKFRELIDWLMTDCPHLKQRLSHPTKNEFCIIADYGDQRLIALKDAGLDGLFASTVPNYKVNELYTFLNQSKRYVNARIELIDAEVKKISLERDSVYGYTFGEVDVRNYLFLFNSKLITFL